MQFVRLFSAALRQEARQSRDLVTVALRSQPAGKVQARQFSGAASKVSFATTDTGFT